MHFRARERDCVGSACVFAFGQCSLPSRPKTAVATWLYGVKIRITVSDTKVRAVVTGAGAIAVRWLLLRVRVPEFIPAVVAWSVIHGGHLGSGWLPAFGARAVWPGVHDLDTESPGWVEWDPPDPAEPSRVDGFALAEPTWHRLEIAAGIAFLAMHLLIRSYALT